MKYVVTVADDFGFSEGVNDGCFDALENGILRELSFMVDSPGSVDAVARSKAKGLDKHIGIHLTLNDLVGTGKYLRTADYDAYFAQTPTSKVQERVKLELKKFEDLFERFPSHINGHHNVHSNEKVYDVVLAYAVEHNIWVRKIRPFTDGKFVKGEDPEEINTKFTAVGVKMTDYIFEHISGSYDEAYAGFVSELEGVPDDTVTEIFFHPARVDATLRQYSSLADDRERDVKLLKDKSFQEQLEAIGCAILDFTKLPQ